MNVDVGSSDPPSARRVLTRLIGLHLFAIAMICLTTVLGVWQWESYTARQDADAQATATSVPVPLTDVLLPDAPLTADADGARVTMAGRWAPADQELAVGGRDQGYWVARPFLVDGSAMLVVLGATDSATLPAELGLDGRPTTITGVVQPSEPGTDRLDSDRVIDNLNTAVLASAVPTDIYSAFVVRTYDRTEPPAGLTAVEPRYPDSSWSAGLRNLLYAVQWWVFGLFAAFMWWRICSDRVREAQRRVPVDAQVA